MVINKLIVLLILFFLNYRLHTCDLMVYNMNSFSFLDLSIIFVMKFMEKPLNKILSKIKSINLELGLLSLFTVIKIMIIENRID